MAIFISYRREDSQAITGRIDDHLRMVFGDADVYRDIDSIPLGADFVQHVREALTKCDICIAVVGRAWLSDRLKQDGDFVRLELETVLARSIPVIPVLVDGAELPRPEQIPESLLPLLRRQAATIDSGSDFKMHIGRIVDAIRAIRAGPGRRDRGSWRSKTLVFAVAATAVVGAGVSVAAMVIRHIAGSSTDGGATDAAPESAPTPVPPSSQSTTPPPPPPPPPQVTEVHVTTNPTDALVSMDGRALARPVVVQVTNSDKAPLLVSHPGFVTKYVPVDKSTPQVQVQLAPEFASPSLESCGPAKGVVWEGEVSLQLQPNGTTAAVVVEPPFQNTAVGNCVAARFRVAHGATFQGTAIPFVAHFSVRRDCNCAPGDPLCSCPKGK